MKELINLTRGKDVHVCKHLIKPTKSTREFHFISIKQSKRFAVCQECFDRMELGDENIFKKLSTPLVV